MQKRRRVNANPKTRKPDLQPENQPVEIPQNSGAITQENAARKNEGVVVAVIGDVAADWAFVSGESSEPQGEEFQPWKNYRSTHLFAFPGGAWFTGHMIEAALEGPRFSRTYTADLTKGNDVKVEGELQLPLGFSEWKLRPAKGGFFEVVFSERRIERFQIDESILIRIDHNAEDNTHYTAIIHPDVGTAFQFNQEYERHPGSIAPDQLKRCFDAHNMRLVGNSAGELVATYLLIKGAPTLLYSGTQSRDRERSIAVQCFVPTTSTDDRSVFSVSRWRNLSDEKAAPATDATNHSRTVVLSYKKATVDVVHGDLNISVTIRDQGKISPNEAQFDSILSVQPVLRTIPERDKMDGETGVSTKLWIYANPGKCLAMQDPHHLIHTLSELMLHDATPNGDGAIRVYRRRIHHGVEGPQGTPAKVLKSYKPISTRKYRRIAGECHRQIVVVDDDGLGFSETPETWGPFLSEPRETTHIRRINRAREWLVAKLARRQFKAERAKTLRESGRSAGEVGTVEESELREYELRFKERIWEDRELYDRIERKTEDLVQHATQKWLAKTSNGNPLSAGWIVIKASHWLDVEESKLLQMVRECGLAERCIIVVSGDTLRHGLEDKKYHKPGIKLARKVSWEQTYNDFVTAIGRDKLKPLLLACRHLIVRLDLDAVLHFERSEDTTTVPSPWVVPDFRQIATWRPQGRVQIVFDYLRCEGEYADTSQLGEFPGLTSVFVAALVRRIHDTWTAGGDDASGSHSSTDHAVSTGIGYALQCCRRYFDLGYGPRPETIRRFEQLQFPIVQVFGEAPVEACRGGGIHFFADYTNEISNVSSEGEIPYWSILEKRLASKNVMRQNPELQSDPAVNFGYNALQLARDIVRSGTNEVFRKSRDQFPIAKFRNLTVVDRREIEGLRSIRNILSEYVSQTERTSPLSFAVFGPPGSGKSFGVREIARAIARGSDIQDFTFNLAQFSSFAEVTQQLLRVRDAGLENRLPLVFFDEFDSELDKRPLGWLKFFLAPMQDGKFQHGETMLGIGRAILVFAGGVAASHDDFNSEEFWASQYPNVAGHPFRAAKGPDFHSRLRGFLNIVGPNPRARPHNDSSTSSRSDREDEFVYVIRRAVLIRQTIEEMEKKTGATLLDNRNQASLDNDVLDALLLTDEYKHGVRSLTAILEMSTLHRQQRISKSSLPAWDQCSMHVDKSFRDILWHNYSELRSVVRDILEAVSKSV